MKHSEMVGQRFGRLYVMSKADMQTRGYSWLCVCDCGKTTIVRGSSLRSGHTKSCGCLKDELSSIRLTEQNITHGESKTRLYEIWTDMRKRCTNIHHWAFDRYGGRGITVCKEWENYENFLCWSKQNGYEDDLTLDRIDNDGDYCPENCRWVDRKTQCRNKSNNRKYTYGGKTLTIPEWSEITGIKTSTLYGRINQYGWDIEKTLTTTPKGRKK